MLRILNSKKTTKNITIEDTLSCQKVIIPIETGDWVEDVVSYLEYTGFKVIGTAKNDNGRIAVIVKNTEKKLEQIF